MKCSMYFPSCFDSNSGSSTYFYFAINTPAALRRLVVVLLVAWPPAITLWLWLYYPPVFWSRPGMEYKQFAGVQQQWETVSGHYWLLRGHRSWRIDHEYVGHNVTDSFCTEQKCFDIEWSMSNSTVSYYFQFCCVVLVGIKYLMISIM